MHDGRVVRLRSYQFSLFLAGFFYPPLTGSLCDVLCIIIIFFFLPETVPRERKRMVTPVESVKRMIGTFLSRDNPKRRVLLLLLLAAFFIGVFGDYGSSKVGIVSSFSPPFSAFLHRRGSFGA